VHDQQHRQDEEAGRLVRRREMKAWKSRNKRSRRMKGRRG
jgi:hypothetical protein